MARQNIDPSWDLTKHLIDGSTGPQSGNDVRGRDQEWDRNDPMDPMTAIPGPDDLTYPQSAEAIAAANLAQAAGLGGTWGFDFRGAVNMADASANTPMADSSDSGYGNQTDLDGRGASKAPRARE